MMGDFLRQSKSFVVSPLCFASAPTISLTMAWLRQPSAVSSPPRRCISFSRTFPASSMKLTPQRSMLNFWRGEAVRSSRQHCSRAATQGPARRPSTLRVRWPRLVSVVIRSMWVISSGRVGSKENAKDASEMTELTCLLFIGLHPRRRRLDHQLRLYMGTCCHVAIFNCPLMVSFEVELFPPRS